MVLGALDEGRPPERLRRWTVNQRLVRVTSLLALASATLVACIPKKDANVAPVAPSVVVLPGPVGGAAPSRAKTAAPGGVAPGEAVASKATGGKKRKDDKPRGKTYGDKPTSHREALERQLEGKFDRRSDKDGQVRLPLADAKHWKRVRFLGVDHLTGFQYGSDHDVVTSAFVVKTPPGEKPTSRACMASFEQDGLAKFKRHKGKLGQLFESEGRWKKQPLVAHQADGKLTVFFSRYEFSAAWVAYPAYEDGCLVVATVVLWDDEPELAQQVRDRWLREAIPMVQMKTRVVPYRK